VIAVWPMTMAARNVAMALDPATHRLFIGRRSGDIVALDSRTGKELQTLKIGERIDDLIFEPELKSIYASCGAGDGSTVVYQELAPDHYRLLGDVATLQVQRTKSWSGNSSVASPSHLLQRIRAARSMSTRRNDGKIRPGSGRLRSPSRSASVPRSQPRSSCPSGSARGQGWVVTFPWIPFTMSWTLSVW